MDGLGKFFLSVMKIASQDFLQKMLTSTKKSAILNSCGVDGTDCIDVVAESIRLVKVCTRSAGATPELFPEMET